MQNPVSEHPEICARCGARLTPGGVCESCASRTTRPLGTPRPVAEAAPDGTTLFQPGLIAAGLTEELADEASASIADPTGVRHTQTLGGAAPSPSPPLPGGFGAYFLILGAAPGCERLELRSARTVLGRDGDLTLDDPSVSSRHCRIEVMGEEVFVRDLESKNGTWLNGHRIRYSELLPGDELGLGDAALVFRTSKDGLSKVR